MTLRLLSLREVPSWSDANPFILSGYRPESRSWLLCFRSWLYCHNETGNIFSHLIPAVVLALGAAAGLLGTDSLDAFDSKILAIHLATAILCLAVSALYHTGLSHSEPVAHQWLQFDYGGILALILGNFVSGLHFGFYCTPALKLLYWTLIATGSASTGGVLLSPWFRGPEWRLLRLTALIATGMFAFAPISHAWYLWGLDYLFHIGVPYYLLEGALLLIGCYIYQTRIPESLFPGRFDIWGSSHTLWHIFVVLSIIAHTQGLSSARDYVQRQAHCRTKH